MRNWLTTLVVSTCAVLGAPIPQAQMPAPGIAIARDGTRVQITFVGALESSEKADGPWLLLSEAVSPLMVPPDGAQMFYRLRIDSGAESIFDARSIAEFAVSGPLQKHFELAFAGMPDGIFPPLRQKPYFDASVRIAGKEIPVTLRVRGNSSLQECPFPKLKFKVSKEERPGTPFFDAREVKIGTHCAEGGQGNVGRLRDERAAFREALAYETMEALGFVTPRARRARIAYKDTTPTSESEAAGWEVSRSAMILEDVEVVAERLGGRALSDEETAALTEAGFDRQLLVDLQLLHALLGNWDYGLFQNTQGLWNTEVIELPGPRNLPIAGDFDLASWVTEKVRLSAPRDYRPDLPDLERQAQYEIERIQDRFSRESFAAAMQRFREARAVIEATVAAAEIDEPGRTNAQRHIEAFFSALPVGSK